MIYGDGVVCLLEESSVRIVDLHGSKGERRLHINALLGTLATDDNVCDWNHIQMLSYGHDTLIFRYTDGADQNWLLAAKLSVSGQVQQLIDPERLRSTNRLFALQSEDWLFYGTRSAAARWCNQPYREWLIQGISLGGKKFGLVDDIDGTPRPSSKTERIQLHSFAGAEIGSSAAFKIHDGYFYGVTNYDAFDVIEVDFTSYYHCIRFPLKRAQQSTCEAARKVYRRQHIDGPVNDGWNTLELQVNEDTNDLMIVEGRAEWPFGGGDLSHGVYSHKLEWDDQDVDAVHEHPARRGPMDDPLSKIPDAETKYSPTPSLPSYHDHMDSDHRDATATASIPTLLTRSKWRGYNFSSMVSLQLLELPCSCTDTSAHCLQLRAASRRAMAEAGSLGSKGKAPAGDAYGNSKKFRASLYHYSPVSFWPTHCVKMHGTMNLPAHLRRRPATELKTWMDERSIVYIAKAGDLGKVVCLTFDGDAPVAGFRSGVELSFSSMPSSRPRGRSPRQASDPEHTRQISPAREPWDQAVFDPDEINPAFLESTWDLEGIPDAEQLQGDVLEPWFDSLGNCDDIMQSRSRS